MKKALRNQIRETRKSLSPDLYAKKSRAIRLKLESLDDFKNADKIMIYVSTDEEVDTHDLVKDCLSNGQIIYVPKVENDKLAICPITDWHQLEPGYFGILEPCEIINEAHPADLDLILVPGVAFDKKGHRIGYGKGFYDSLLKNTKGKKIGLAFSEQIIDEIPAEDHDVPLDLIITDQSIITP